MMRLVRRSARVPARGIAASPQLLAARPM
jgi:hypothetical protein